MKESGQRRPAGSDLNPDGTDITQKDAENFSDN